MPKHTSLRNTDTHWGRISRAFHWGLVVLAAIQIPLGFYMVDVYEFYTETYADDRLPMVLRTSMSHHTIGFLILTLATFRLAWRASNPTPGLPANLAAYQRRLARTTHVLLYILMFAYPLSGWAALSSYEGEFPIFFFGWDSMPRIVPQVAEGQRFDYDFFAQIHRFGWRVGALILGLHVFGALWHQFVAKDGILKRMWRGEAS
jgi:cytochrome b561